MGSIIIKNLNIRYEDNLILNNINEYFQDAQLYGLIGSSGSGKTTLLKAIAGLLIINEGSIEVNGRNIVKASQRRMLDYHKNCGFVFQNSALISNMSIYENLALYYQYHTDMTDKEIYTRIKYYLDYTGFTDDISRRPTALSLGEKMLINIIRAISHEPEYIFWDNPLPNLDISTQRKVKQIITDLKKQGKTMVLVSNDSKFVLSVADKVGILTFGKIIESGTPEEVERSDIDLTKELLGKE